LFKTKKPPFIHPPSPDGFSKKLLTIFPLIFIAPNLPGGFTAKMVANFLLLL
jgi:hypothetical protein